MKVIPSGKLGTALPFIAFAVTVMLGSQAPQAGRGGAPAAGPTPGAAPQSVPAAPARGDGAGAATGAGGGRGGGRGAAPLGDGPFDVGEGENRLHVTVM